MTKVLGFRIEIAGLENKIWREIEITSRRTVADLAYVILASFRSSACHLYDITYKDKVYDCGIDNDMIQGEMPLFADEMIGWREESFGRLRENMKGNKSGRLPLICMHYFSNSEGLPRIIIT